MLDRRAGDARAKVMTGLRTKRIFGVVAATAVSALVAGILYLELLWLPDRDPGVLAWPQSLALLGVPMLLAASLRGAPLAGRVTVLAACLTISAMTVWLGAFVIFVVESR